MKTKPAPGVTWLCMTLDTTRQQAMIRFRQRYGCDPAEVRRDHNMVWVGPVPADQAPTPPAAANATNGAGE